MKGHPLAQAYSRHLEGSRLAISFMTVAELYEGAYRADWGSARFALLEHVLKGYLVIPATPSVCKIWGKVRAIRRARPISPEDAWIAATALAFNCPLVTHNAADFDGIPDLIVVTEHHA